MNSNVKEMKIVLISAVFIMLMIVVRVSPTTVLAISGFIANPTDNNNTGTGTADPNYNTYQNLALGFNIKYLKNMTISERLQNGSFNTLVHVVSFHLPLDRPFKEHILMEISIIPETNFLGQQYGLDQTVRNLLTDCCVKDNTTVISKIKGMLNGIPAYKVEQITLVPKSVKNITSSLGFDGIPIKYQYKTTYVSFRDGIGYWIQFYTYSPDRFNPVEKTMIDSFRYN
jgi:hypothetical protein